MPRLSLLPLILLALPCLAVPVFGQALDTDFGGGRAYTRLHARRGSNQATALAQQADGKLVVPMSTGNQGAEPGEIAVLRLRGGGPAHIALGRP